MRGGHLGASNADCQRAGDCADKAEIQIASQAVSGSNFILYFERRFKMKRANWILLGFVIALALALTVSNGLSKQESKEQAKKAKVELPAAVLKAVKDNVPNAVIEIAEVEEEAGITLYDIEFKAGKGEIEVAQDGTVMDVATIVSMKDIPKAAAEAIQKAAEGATIKQLEKSEVRAEIKKEGEKGKIVKLDSPRYVYEAELVKGNQRGEMEVGADGKVIEALKWSTEGAKVKKEMKEEEEEEEQEEKEEQEEAEVKEKVVDLKILPEAVLSAFKAAYPNAVIKGTSKETEKGVTYYEIESVDGTLNRDLLYTADGKAAEIEEAIAASDLPVAVQQTLAKEYPGAKVLKAERMTRGDQRLFELKIQVKDKKMGVTIDPSGKIVEKTGGAKETEKK
jgi:hypothetical protein